MMQSICQNNYRCLEHCFKLNNQIYYGYQTRYVFMMNIMIT
ncbi:hypothetical protein CoNPh17_CDS0150 [Staphylococcus phage S-CoN_Ph17]|nr:hypothetical protein CoNPh17_CDS0150 [Staphylococcus phage S-CoN_Ph17]